MPRTKKNDSPKFTKKEIPVRKEGGSGNFFMSDYDNSNDMENDFMANEGQLSCDVYQDKNNIYIKSTIAGVDQKNLDISVSNDVLTIRGFREDENEIDGDNYYSREIYWGAFSRSIVLPQEVAQKKVEAILKSGVLTITLPKKYKTSSIRIKQLED